MTRPLVVLAALALLAVVIRGRWSVATRGESTPPPITPPDDYAEPVPMAAWVGMRTGNRYDLTDPAQARAALYHSDATVNDVRRACGVRPRGWDGTARYDGNSHTVHIRWTPTTSASSGGLT